MRNHVTECQKQAQAKKRKKGKKARGRPDLTRFYDSLAIRGTLLRPPALILVGIWLLFLDYINLGRAVILGGSNLLAVVWSCIGVLACAMADEHAYRSFRKPWSYVQGRRYLIGSTVALALVLICVGLALY